MKLATVDYSGRSRVCVVADDHVVLVGTAGHDDLRVMYEAGERGRADLAAACQGHGERISRRGVRFLRPVLDPGAVICVGLNYRSHLTELGRGLPSAPTLFSKLPHALCDPDADVPLPPSVTQLDYEGEFVVVISRTARHVAAADAWDFVGGVSLMNDVSARDYQRRTSQWFAGKTWEASTPWGPVVATRDELTEATLEVTVNGERRQSGSFDDLLFDVPQLVADISQIVALRPGDLIATGTPDGVGMAAKPERYLGDGDVVVVRSAAIGELRNVVRATGGNRR
ncbi:hypothetical protein GCM10022222_59690 [Amycolatopsis ultiminotia]|uniref:Fumarylacetoacetase-like C-terminal domain-containing protein n=1 Tax=Amycolatopsis ultiminotia TaxID=543629 RepID=A0ABP6XN22_9PSEU